MQNRFLRLIAGLLLACLLFAGCSVDIDANLNVDTAPQTSATQPGTEATAPATDPSTGETLPEQTDPVTGETLPAQTDPVDLPEPTDPVTGETLPEQTDPEIPPQESYPEDTQPETTEPEEPQVPTTKPPAPSTSSGFKVHFIDVGQADAALVICDGKTMLIDGGNSADSNLIYTYLKKQGVSHLDYIIATHAHEDHVGGLSGALNYATVDKVYCPVTAYNSSAFNNFVKNVQKRGASITVPSRGHSFSLGSAQCTVLAVNTSSDTNNSSIVLRIVYGSTSFLFTGDAEREVEEAMINRGAPLSSTVLKVGHHGSYTSTSYAFLWNVMPQYAVISCGKGNSYGHPHDEVLSRLHDADVWTFRTDLQGDIICTSNGSSVSFSVSRNWNADVFGSLGGNTSAPPATQPPATQPPATQPPATQPPATQPEVTQPPQTEPPTEESAGITYVLNNNSMKFHYESCQWAEKISDRNRGEYTGDRQDLIEQGYSPCGSCQP